MSWPEMSLLWLLVIVSHFVGGVAGFGGGLLAMSFFLLVPRPAEFGLTDAVFMLAACGLAQAAWMLAHTWRAVDWHEAGLILPCAGLCLPAGRLLAAAVPAAAIHAALGFLLIGVGLRQSVFLRGASVPGADAETGPSWRRGLGYGLAGAVHGGFACGGAVLVPLATVALTDKQAFRGTLALVWTLLAAALLGALFVQGYRPGNGEVLLAAAALPGVVLATHVAEHVARWLDQATFTRAIGLLMVANGLLFFAKLWPRN